MIYRSTLDPALRMEEKRVITEVGALILATLGLYLTITPGVLGGFVDYYVLRPLLGQKRYTIDDFVVKDKLGEGGFGVVYRATGKNDGETYVLKQCKDYGEAEIWTNSRLQRACPDAIASYCGAFYGPKNFKGRNVIKDGSIWKRALNSRAGQEEEEDPLWIVWKFEGSDTLFKLMNDKDFPYNVEPYLFKSGVAIDGEPKGTKRKAKIISTIFGQIWRTSARRTAPGSSSATSSPRTSSLTRSRVSSSSSTSARRRISASVSTTSPRSSSWTRGSAGRRSTSCPRRPRSPRPRPWRSRSPPRSGSSTSPTDSTRTPRG
jgi:hypothetical protein